MTLPFQDESAVSPVDPSYPHRYYMEPGCAWVDNKASYTGSLGGGTDYVAQFHGNNQRIRAK